MRYAVLRATGGGRAAGGERSSNAVRACYLRGHVPFVRKPRPLSHGGLPRSRDARGRSRGRRPLPWEPSGGFWGGLGRSVRSAGPFMGRAGAFHGKRGAFHGKRGAFHSKRSTSRVHPWGLTREAFYRAFTPPGLCMEGPGLAWEGLGLAPTKDEGRRTKDGGKPQEVERVGGCSTLRRRLRAPRLRRTARSTWTRATSEAISAQYAPTSGPPIGASAWWRALNPQSAITNSREPYREKKREVHGIGGGPPPGHAATPHVSARRSMSCSAPAPCSCVLGVSNDDSQ